jgi:rubrerythrin
MNYATDHTLQIAEEMERQGKIFFESFAAVCENSGLAALAASLAVAEQNHLSIFRQIREALPPDRQLTVKELAEAAQELRNTVIPDARTVRLAVLSSDLCAALDMAIAMKNRTTACYSDLAARCRGPYAAVLAQLVEEEKDHLRMLRQHRDRLFPGKAQTATPRAA